ncbi:MAG: hypothetical protein AB7I18_04700 [Candidatus Berkiella sp.]
MMGPSGSMAIDDETVNRKNRSTSFSLSPEDKTFLPVYHLKQKHEQELEHELITIKPQFNNELIAESIEQHHYLSSEDREKHLVTIQDGFFKDAMGDFLSGPHVYVLHPKLRLYAVKVGLKINHSHLSSGLPAKGAGMLYFDYGRLITMSNNSGHYKPTFVEMQEAINWFYAQTGSAFIFEDHSMQDKNVELRGIRYFSKSEQGLTELKVAELAKAVYEVKASALESLKISQEQPCEMDIDSSSELSGDDCYTTQLADVEVMLPVAESILDCPDLLQHTCFYRLANGESISRFNGLPVLSPRKKQ